MLLREFLTESLLPSEASLQKKFDFKSIDNRRFIYDPVSRRFVIGGILPKGRNLIGSHAEDWFNVTGSNKYFDRCVRGWIGTGGSYKNGIIHFAPPVRPYDDGPYACLKTFVLCGATEKTKLRGALGMDFFEEPLGKVMPDLFS